MKVSEYLTKYNITQKDFAKMIDCSTTTVNFYFKGMRRPFWERATRIVEISKGEITYEDLGYEKSTKYIKKKSTSPNPDIEKNGE